MDMVLSDADQVELARHLRLAAGLCRTWAKGRAGVPSLADEWRKRAERMDLWRERLGSDEQH